MEQLSDAISGGCGAVISSAALHPLILLKIKLQAAKKRVVKDSNEKGSLLRDVVSDILKEEGVSGLYKGLGVVLAKGFCTNFIFYYVMSALEPFVYKNRKRTVARGISTRRSFWCRCSADYVPCRHDSQEANLAKQERSILCVIRDIIAEHGIKGFWQGIGPALALTINPGINTVVRMKLMELSGEGNNATKKFSYRRLFRKLVQAG